MASSCPLKILTGYFEMKFRRSQGSNSYFTRWTPRTPPRRTEFHFSFILLLDTTVAEIVGLIVWSIELDQTAILGITPTTMQIRFIIHRLGLYAGGGSQTSATDTTNASALVGRAARWRSSIPWSALSEPS
jgi:hypothetical protein